MSNTQELLFLDNLEQLMKEHNVSKRELAEAVGISPSTITTQNNMQEKVHMT